MIILLTSASSVGLKVIRVWFEFPSQNALVSTSGCKAELLIELPIFTILSMKNLLKDSAKI